MCEVPGWQSNRGGVAGIQCLIAVESEAPRLPRPLAPGVARMQCRPLIACGQSELGRKNTSDDNKFVVNPRNERIFSDTHAISENILARDVCNN